LKQVRDDLEAEAPDPGEADWPEPAEGDEDDDPLFDSTRDYLTQIHRYKEHQGKEVRAKPKRVYAVKERVCECGATFMTARGLVCEECRRERRNDAVKRYRGKKEQRLYTIGKPVSEPINEVASRNAAAVEAAAR
jgi:hypothetical protein